MGGRGSFVSAAVPLLLLASVGLAACRGDDRDADAGRAGALPVADAAADGMVDGSQDIASELAALGERYWLELIERGGSLADRICNGERDDAVTQAVCVAGAKIDDLVSLYRGLGLEPDPPVSIVNLAIGAASSGLSFELVSALNPRTFVMTGGEGAHSPHDPTVVVAFTRGEQLVEIAAIDAKTGAINFYLVRYEPSCAPDCTVTQSLSDATERDWRRWDLFTERELEDTPFDCLSCHRPDGPGTRTRFLMRDFPIPWFHWLPPEPITRPCLDADGGETPPVNADPRLRLVFERNYPDGYGGFPVKQTQNSDGHNLHSFVAGFSGIFEPLPRDEPFVMDTVAVMAEWRCQDRHDTWQLYRARTLETLGFPIPYFKLDLLDPVRANDAKTDFQRFLATQPPTATAVDVLQSLVEPEARLGTGMLIADTDDAGKLLRQACVRCHDRRASPGSRRALFNVDSPTAAGLDTAIARLGLAPESAFAMPPRRASLLTTEARAHLVRYLQELRGR